MDIGFLISKNMKLVRRLVLIFLITALFISGFPSFHIFAEKNLRIISLAPSTTEILFELGLDKNIVGVSNYCDYPPEALTKEKVGSFSQPSIEKIISLKPDLILVAGLEQQPAADKLKKLRLNFLLVYPSDTKGLISSIRKIGAASGCPKKAEALIEKINGQINRLKKKVQQIPIDKRKTVFIEIWNDPIITAGKGSFVNELIGLAGGINIAADIPRSYSMISPEVVISQNPDCIILGYMSPDSNNNYKQQKIKMRTGWKNISALKNDKIFSDINPDLILRPGPRCVRGAEEIYKRLYEQ